MPNKSKKNESFIQIPRELNKSPSWRFMSTNCTKLIGFLTEEHLSNGGKGNGNLISTYDQLVDWGIPRRLIHRTISEAEALGLIRVERGGRKGFTNHLSRFHVTFLPTCNNGYWQKPANDWVKVSLDEIMTFQRKHKIKSWLRHETNTVPQSNNSQLQHAQT